MTIIVDNTRNIIKPMSKEIINSRKEYDDVSKNVLFLGGSQTVQMGTALIRAKIIAIVLGPIGMGVNSLFISTLMVVQQISSIGIYQSAVRELSILHKEGEKEKLSALRCVFLNLSKLCGVFGIILMSFLAPFLSLFLFGDYAKTWHFLLLSIALFFMALYNGYSVMMQATKHLKLMSKATIVGAIGGLFVSAGSIFFFKLDGIVPAIIAGYVIFWISFKYYGRKMGFEQVASPPIKESWRSSIPIIKLGLVLMVSSFMITFFIFALNGIINAFGSVKDVGYYQSSASVISQSLLISNIILSSDFYPRLSAVNNDTVQVRKTVNQQIDILMYIIVPISAVLIVFAPVIVWILYTPDFVSAISLIRVMAIALIFRVLWMIYSYIILAKGDKKNYFIFDAFVGNGLNFLLSIIGFFIYGIMGIAIASVFSSLIISLLLGWIVKRRYSYSIERKQVILIFSIATILALLMILNSLFNSNLSYFISIIICIGLCFWAIRQLFNKTSIFSILIKKK